MKVRKMGLDFIVIFIMVMSVFAGTASSHKNPMTLTDEWNSYGIGDPYIMKYNGMYYLYVSTKDSETGIKCWSSPDLANFTYEGLCTTHPLSKAAFAPEVFYWNGHFYMYTSPAGQGHYVFKSSNPTGPFEPVTGNLGLSIDGSVFVDDDGSKYFYYAGYPEILVNPMNSHESISNQVIRTGLTVNGMWTEGPAVFKRNGLYYITYCGNHVINDAYRIHYAVSDNPVSGFVPAGHNPILGRAEGDTRGLGHNSIVIGPDLDTYYMIYHNLVSLFGPMRQMNIDPIVWNGDKLYVLGPTDFEVDDPEMPAFHLYFNESEGQLVELANGKGKFILSSEETKKDYTAEFNFWAKELRDGDNDYFGVIYSFVDMNNYGYALVNPKAKTLDVGYVLEGEDKERTSSSLPGEMDFTVLHNIKIQKQGATFKFYIDGMLKQTREIPSLQGGNIGYLQKGIDGEYGFTAFSDKVNGSHDYTFTKPVPGGFDAIHANSGNKDVLVASDEGGHGVTLNEGQYLQFDINVKKTGYYTFDMRYASEVEAILSFVLDDEGTVEDIDLPSTERGKYRTYPIRAFRLEKGKHSLKVKVDDGTLDLYRLNINEIDKRSTKEMNNPRLTTVEGTFANQNNVYTGRNSAKFGKAVFGTERMGDYTFETTITLDEGIDAGILFRAKMLTNGNATDLGINSPDYHQGYYAAINKDGVLLGKQNFDFKVLASAPYSIEIGVPYTLKVEAVGDTFSIYLNGDKMIEYTDYDNPFTTGKVGIRGYMSEAKFENVVLQSYWDEYAFESEDPTPGETIPPDDETEPPVDQTPGDPTPSETEDPTPAEEPTPPETEEPTPSETDEPTPSGTGEPDPTEPKPDESERPDGSNDKDRAPKTGDNSMLLALLLMIAAAGTITYMIMKRVKA